MKLYISNKLTYSPQKKKTKPQKTTKKTTPVSLINTLVLISNSYVSYKCFMSYADTLAPSTG